MVVDADRPRLLREQVTTDLLAASAPGEAVHPSEQFTTLTPHDGGTVLTWRLTTPAPLWARPLVRWSVLRSVRRIFDGLAAELAQHDRR